ncbi:MAG TPA: tRNA (N6-threonylcarbamoyladenosine(37)-N6)-methyltransferase TrmO [Candidatus Akkermansia intestinigallinarum]|uniref:tRNA (N6-threonylcarbamoyladenosine(37)-N6)-methyltransferase TrmO n=1 Tax=Candidatus Akkermansia intestinigallinarum TaxID=2838431 RepID=A0A9D1VBF6_9BACT|nr:tRNA (N6-threonylcarbamoyladenosine(37)-N6)-methyltransferase TrmO [Candidatus Akkermansia intestinigallinarum]
MEPVAHIRSPYPEKFGVPRQGNLAPHVLSDIVLAPPFRDEACVRGLEEFSHIWLIWGFDRNGSEWHPTVRPPRLGGNERLGVFATRSPFRPNGLGLSVVKLEAVLPGPVLRVSGADLVDGSPIYDIKPYVPYADAIPDAAAGFTRRERPTLRVDLPEELLPPGLPPHWREGLAETLAQDPRPAYQRDPERVYHLLFEPCEVHFSVDDGIAHVHAVEPLSR